MKFLSKMGRKGGARNDCVVPWLQCPPPAFSFLFIRLGHRAQWGELQDQADLNLNPNSVPKSLCEHELLYLFASKSPYL